MKHFEKKANGWVFISHSSEDYEDVKIIRNYLERRGFSAIMFYLKALEPDEKKQLTQKLIKWEIEARNFFVLCDSKDARNSTWVQKEIDLVKQFPEKTYETIDMENIKYNQYRKYKELSKLKGFFSKNSLFFSYVKADEKQVDEIFFFLNLRGFRIFNDTPILENGDEISYRIMSALEDTIGKGAVLMFLSQNVIVSNQFWSEKDMALNSNAFIIPILLDDIDIHNFPAFRSLTQDMYINIKNGFNDEEKNKLINLIKKGAV